MVTTPGAEAQPVRKSYAEAAEREFLLKSSSGRPFGTPDPDPDT
jgi:hypothetical protein